MTFPWAYTHAHLRPDLPLAPLTGTWRFDVAAQSLTNTANATWASQPGGTVATGASAPSSVSETVSAAPTLTKRLVKVAPPAGSPIVAGANSGLTSVLSTQLGQGATLTYDLIAVLGVDLDDLVVVVVVAVVFSVLARHDALAAVCVSGVRHSLLDRVDWRLALDSGGGSLPDC